MIQTVGQRVFMPGSVYLYQLAPHKKIIPNNYLVQAKVGVISNHIEGRISHRAQHALLVTFEHMRTIPGPAIGHFMDPSLIPSSGPMSKIKKLPKFAYDRKTLSVVSIPNLDQEKSREKDGTVKENKQIDRKRGSLLPLREYGIYYSSVNERISASFLPLVKQTTWTWGLDKNARIRKRLDLFGEAEPVFQTNFHDPQDYSEFPLSSGEEYYKLLLLMMPKSEPTSYHFATSAEDIYQVIRLNGGFKNRLFDINGNCNLSRDKILAALGDKARSRSQLFSIQELKTYQSDLAKIELFMQHHSHFAFATRSHGLSRHLMSPAVPIPKLETPFLHFQWEDVASVTLAIRFLKEASYQSWRHPSRFDPRRELKESLDYFAKSTFAISSRHSSNQAITFVESDMLIQKLKYGENAIETVFLEEESEKNIFDRFGKLKAKDPLIQHSILDEDTYSDFEEVSTSDSSFPDSKEEDGEIVPAISILNHVVFAINHGISIEDRLKSQNLLNHLHTAQMYSKFVLYLAAVSSDNFAPLDPFSMILQQLAYRSTPNPKYLAQLCLKRIGIHSIETFSNDVPQLQFFEQLKFTRSGLPFTPALRAIDAETHTNIVEEMFVKLELDQHEGKYEWMKSPDFSVNFWNSSSDIVEKLIKDPKLLDTAELLKPTDLDYETRVDLTGLENIAVDSQSTTEVDDSFCIENLDQLIEHHDWAIKHLENPQAPRPENFPSSISVMIHIADPTSYIHLGDKLDLIARQRVTSTYLPHRVTKMIPAVLSEYLLSLKPMPFINTALTFKVKLDSKTGEIITGDVFPSKTSNMRRVDFETVEKLVGINSNSDLDLCDDPSHFSYLNDQSKLHLRLLNAIARLRRVHRCHTGSMINNFKSTSAVVKTIENSHYIDKIELKRDETPNASMMVEEFMQLCSIVTASIGLETGATLPYRIQPQISVEQLSPDLLHFQSASSNVLPSEFNSPFYWPPENWFENPEASMSKAVLISSQFKSASYSNRSEFHASVNSYYCRASSPLRRYPDMLAHYQLKHLFRIINQGIYHGNNHSKKLDSNREYLFPLSFHQMGLICMHMNFASKRLIPIERQCERYWKTQYVLHHGWNELYDAIVVESHGTIGAYIIKLDLIVNLNISVYYYYTRNSNGNGDDGSSPLFSPEHVMRDPYIVAPFGSTIKVRPVAVSTEVQWMLHFESIIDQSEQTVKEIPIESSL